MNATTTSPLDVAALRRRFPALSRTVDGRPAAFLDGPGGSQTPDAVIDAMTAYLRGSNANLGGAFVTSAESDALYERARQAGADFTGSRPEEIAFGANMTTLNFLLAHAVARTLKEGDEIIVTQLDHDGNVSPWLRIADDYALTVHTVPVRPDDVTLDIDALEALLSDRTKIVAFTLASNAVGSKPDARRISDLAHSVGALAWADAVHYAPHGRIDRVAHGPRRRRLLAVQVLRPAPGPGRDPPRPGRALARRPRAPGRRDARRPPLRDRHAVARGAGRLRRRRRVPGGAGGGRHAAASASTRPSRASRAYEESLSAHALTRLTSTPGVRLYGIADPARVAERTPTFAFTIAGATPRDIAAELGREGIFVWDGNYYALGAMLALGLEEHGGAVRAGFLHYTTLDEVDRFCDLVAAIAARG